MKARANLIAFSTASLPALKNAALTGPGDRRPLGEPLGERDVRLVRDDREVGVGETLELLVRGGDDLWMAVADVQAADAAGEVDERVPVDVRERRTTCRVGDDRERDRERARDRALDPLADRARPKARNLGLEQGRSCGWQPSEPA